MLPDQLTPGSFASYPPEARRLATRNIEILRRLPLAFAPLLLRELIVYDWKFPAERADLDRQFAYLGGLTPEAFRAEMSRFAALKLTRELERIDWVNTPAIYSEQLSAHLWATHQIDGFSAAAVDYVAKATASAPDAPPAAHRLVLAAIGQGVSANDYRLFRKLRPHGTYYTRVKSGGGVRTLLDAVEARAAAYPGPYRHWYIDGGAPLESAASVTRIAYGALAVPRSMLESRMQKTYEAPVFDPEAFRTMLAQLKPEELGFHAGNETLNRFQLSLLTEGSGTQVFSTTFVQWAAREALRRAQPLTLLVRFAQRQREKQMNELLAEHQRPPDPDPAGSLIDADMGAYYTWINQQRLAGAEKSAFLAWFEDHGEAVVIATGLEGGRQSAESIDLAKLVERLA
jgi:hypothetical protein